MKLNVLALAAGLVAATPAFATNYHCKTPKNEVSAFLVFDDGPGGLDALEMTAFGKGYTDVLFEDSPNNIEELMSRDTNRGTFEYGGDKLEIGFTGGKIKFDIFAKRSKKDTLAGRIVITGHKSVTTLNLTCKED